MNNSEQARKGRRIHVTFTDGQLDKIKLGVKLGIAINETEYVRLAVHELNKELVNEQRIKELIEENERLQQETIKLSFNADIVQKLEKLQEQWKLESIDAVINKLIKSEKD